jgi:hypothetical protein
VYYEEAPGLSGIDWNRVARGGALAEALAVEPHLVGDTRGGDPATVLSVAERDGVRLEDDALVVRLAADALVPEADRGTGAGRHDAWWEAWGAALVAWRRSGRPRLVVDTWALVFDGPDAICLLARAVGVARNQARDYGKSEGSGVHVAGGGADLLRLRERCIEEELPEREKTVLRMSEAGRLYVEIAEHIGISTTSTSRIYQLDQQGNQRLRKALARRLAEVVVHTPAATVAGGLGAGSPERHVDQRDGTGPLLVPSRPEA